ncbi:preprotein translocase subunit SecE [Candidatus Wolfebacteria bacterium CG03_land_8_20_14_0_80_36_15]|uniref:Protein translocase subunit SecE n=1 Tax=Candidatus Wolfebacteria bacterium CG03_land_8_20_14_0_80_36_15 TaxID=1975067 RepID=A0A2M7B7F1_9BACT|nr:MAG: preprotein translocase subunit SecE [Candidatus Wolfebacteria bacterium CG03_land_8_20_14_0_80_36_15]
MLEKLKNYLKESNLEMRRVSWPTKQKTLHLTFIVIGVSLIFAVYLGLLDFIFITILSRFFS